MKLQASIGIKNDNSASLEATCVIARNPFDLDDLEICRVHGAPKLSELALTHGLDNQTVPVVCNLSGRWVLQKHWQNHRISGGDVVQFIHVPQGGGDGKSPLAIVLQVALLIAAVVLPPLAGAAFGAAVGAGIGIGAAAGASLVTAITGAAILAGGTLLINAVVPPQSAGNATSGSSVSPTYSIGAQGNQARLGGVIPVIYGRHKVFPDFAATPYWEYIDNDQFLYQLHVVGQGLHVITDVRLGDSPVGVFEEVEVEIIQPGEPVTLVETDIFTSSEISGQTLRANNDLRTGQDGWIGPFAASPPGRVTSHISIDIIAPGGLYKINDDGGVGVKSATWDVQVREIDDAGAPLGLGDWTALYSGTLSGTDERAAIRTSFEHQLASTARFEVRIKRTDDKDLSARAAHEIVWGGLRGDLQGQASFEGLTLIAVKMRATDNLNQATSRRLNCIATRKLPVWDGTNWSAPVETTSIAWIAADILRDATYGGGALDERIDLDGLLALDQVWSARLDECNGVFDTPTTVWQALGKVLRCGRTRPYHQGGMIRFHRDAPQSLPVMLFSGENIVSNSFKMEFALPVYGDSADGIELEYYDDRVWRPAYVSAHVVGDAGDNLAKETVWGITDADQAQREADYQAYSNRYRRRFISFETELEGLIPSIGDLVVLAHDLPQWGLSGQVVGYDPQSLILTLDHAHDVDETVYIRLRMADGGITGALDVQYWDGQSVKLVTDPGISISTGQDRERTHYILGSTGNEPRDAICTGIVPRGDRVQVNLVLEDDRVHVN